MSYKAGSRWQSQVCEGEVVVVRSFDGDGTLQCGGAPMQLSGSARETVAGATDLMAGCIMGKRYRSEGSPGLEVLCVKAGRGTLGFAGQRLVQVEAKSLPSSD